METATKMRLGATESRESSNRVYVSLRTGKISEVSKDENETRPGFKAFTTENKSGTKYHFFARTYDDLCGYIKDVRWNEHTLTDGTRLAGWQVYVDAGDKEFVLQVQTNDRPYQTLMALLPNIDFSEPVRIVAFMGKSASDKPQKVLLLTQNPDITAKDWIKPKYSPKWLTLNLAAKVKEDIELTEDERRNVEYTSDGNADPTFPYIKEKRDGSWSFDAWTEFLFSRMEIEVLPAVQIAYLQRQEMQASAEYIADDEMDILPAGRDNPHGSGYGDHVQTMADDEIPF